MGEELSDDGQAHLAQADHPARRGATMLGFSAVGRSWSPRRDGDPGCSDCHVGPPSLAMTVTHLTVRVNAVPIGYAVVQTQKTVSRRPFFGRPPRRLRRIPDYRFCGAQRKVGG